MTAVYRDASGQSGRDVNLERARGGTRHGTGPEELDRVPRLNPGAGGCVWMS